MFGFGDKKAVAKKAASKKVVTKKAEAKKTEAKKAVAKKPALPPKLGDTLDQDPEFVEARRVIKEEAAAATITLKKWLKPPP